MDNYLSFAKDLNNLKFLEATKQILNFLSTVLDSDIENLEHVESPLNWLDKFAGIDYLCKRNYDNNVFGIASRIQFVGSSFGTFSIRKARHTGTKTEKQKRQESITNNDLYPRFTSQWYFSRSTSKFFNGAIVETKDLYDFVQKHPSLVTQNASDNAFDIVNWHDLKQKGYKVIIIERMFNDALSKSGYKRRPNQCVT